MSRLFRFSIMLFVFVTLAVPSVSALAQDEIVLTFYFLGDEVMTPFVEDVIAGFQAANPGIRINLQTYPNEQYKTAIQVAIASDNPPDIMFNWSGDDTGRFVREGHLLDLTPYAQEFGWYEDVSPAALDAFTFDGKLYGAPYSLEAKYYYYNLAIFEEQGLSVPQTFDELLDICRKLRAAGITPMSFGNQERWEGVHYLTIFNQKVVGEDVILADYSLTPDADVLFTDPNYEVAFQRLLDMQDAGCFADAVNSTTPDNALAQFFTEQVAMYYQGTWIMGPLAQNDFAGKYGMFRMPPMVDDVARGNQNYVLMGPIALEGSSRTKNPDAVAAFLNYYISQETQRKLVERTRRIPVRADALEGIEVPDELAFVVNDLATAEGAVAWLDVVLENRVSEAYLNMIQEVLAGTKTPAEAMAVIREQALAVKASLGL